jgi:hypothetical protein
MLKLKRVKRDKDACDVENLATMSSVVPECASLVSGRPRPVMITTQYPRKKKNSVITLVVVVLGLALFVLMHLICMDCMGFGFFSQMKH